MNYGLSAYTKVLEVEKRIGASNNSKMIIYDSGQMGDISFENEFILNTDNLCSTIGSDIYYKLNFDILSQNNVNVIVSYFINDVLVFERLDSVNANDKKSFNLDFTYKANSELLKGYAKIQIIEGENQIQLSNFRLITFGAYCENKQSSENGVELRACKTPNETFIVSYSSNNVVYACEIDENSTSLNFVSVIFASSHCFAFDKDNKLHLYYVDSTNRLYDKTINSVFNDVLIAENVNSVYATRTSNHNSDDIVIAFIDNSFNAYYTTLCGNNLGEIKKLNLPEAKYIDLSIIAGDKFVYLVATNDDDLSYILKSAYEPLENMGFENITSNMGVVVQKYYSVEENTDNLFDVISASAGMNASISKNYEKIIEEIAHDRLHTVASINLDTYELPSEQTVHYTIVIDKALRTHNTRCVYANDAEGLLPVTNTNDVLEMNGWDNRFPFNKIKPCVLRGGEFLGYLNPNDYTQFEDGTPVNSESSDNFVDVMVEIPKVYYAIENIDPYVYVHVSNQPIDDRFKCYAHVYDGKELDKIYVSAYHCGYKNYNGKNTFFSFTNTLPNCYDIVNSTTYETLLENKEVGYRMLNFDQTILFQCLFILMFKSTGSQHAFAKGNNNNKGSIIANGFCDKLGMYSGSISTANPCKLFGIENLYGNCYTRVEGFNIYAAHSYDTYTFKRRSPYSTVPLNRDGDGYDEYKNPDLDGVYSVTFYFNDPYATTELGFLPKSLKYTGATDSPNYVRFYCDASFIATSYGAWWGGDTRAYTYGGIFHYRDDFGGVMNGFDFGYRLVYYPIGGN